MAKSRDAFRTISEVADWLETPAHVLRFWESKFTQVKPVKRAGGRRYYRPADMVLLGGIKKLLHDDGMTIKGVQKVLREQGVRHVSSLSMHHVEGEDDSPDIIEDAPYIEVDMDAPTDTVVAFNREPVGNLFPPEVDGTTFPADPEDTHAQDVQVSELADDTAVPEAEPESVEPVESFTANEPPSATDETPIEVAPEPFGTAEDEPQQETEDAPLSSLPEVEVSEVEDAVDMPVAQFEPEPESEPTPTVDNAEPYENDREPVPHTAPDPLQMPVDESAEDTEQAEEISARAPSDVEPVPSFAAASHDAESLTEPDPLDRDAPVEDSAASEEADEQVHQDQPGITTRPLDLPDFTQNAFPDVPDSIPATPQPGPLSHLAQLESLSDAQVLALTAQLPALRALNAKLTHPI